MNISIDSKKCMSRKNKKSGIMKQCPHDIKMVDYCKKHACSKNILRIDQPLPQKYIDKLMNIYTCDKTKKKKKVNPKKINPNKMRIYNGQIIETTFDNDSKYKNQPIKSFQTNYKQMDKFSGMNEQEILKIISGPAYENPLLSHTDIDPISQEEIWYEKDGEKILSNEIEQKLLFSYEDEYGYIRCFNIESLRGMFKQNKFKHPVTCIEFSKETIENAKIKIEILEECGDLTIEVEDTELTEDKVKQYTFEVFSKFHKFNIYPKDSWFLDLSMSCLGKMYYETKDFFLQNIPNMEQKKKLVPPNGIAFEHDSDYIKCHKNKLYVQYYLLDNINKIISLCSDNALQTMGTYIALGGLATVSKEARECYKHIAYSFM